MTNGGMRLRSGIQTSLLEEGLREVKYKLEVTLLNPPSREEPKSHFD
jgi:hypothetical protein